MRKLFWSGWIAALAACSLLAQNGDKKGSGEVQVARVPAEKIPPSPPLAPAEALKKFKIAPGFKIQTFAHEPDIQVPVALQFDPDGRTWVLEMRAFMPNADGRGEDEPRGRVSILEDIDGDGAAERPKVFLDGLILPRAFLLVQGGLLLAEPPNLWFYPVLSGDKPGARVLVDDDYAKGGDARLGTRSNPEHSANSLTLALDNWIYSLDHGKRYRFADGKWLREPMPKRAQWGMAQDNFGRLFYNSNSDHARGDLVPSHYVLKAGVNAKLPGLSQKLAEDQSVWPIRVNPGVNRGYQTGTLRADGTLARFTAACGTSIYRGDTLPPECIGNGFLCEPSANVVRRNILEEKDGLITARNAYDRAEFLASTDELFRPVNTYSGPDGALYIVDMYHGIIQHRVFLTSYLRAQSESRGLEKITNYGRIYRVTHESSPPVAKPQMSNATWGELIRQMGSANGWRRDTAQRLLIERHDPATIGALLSMSAKHSNELARLHALWTLEGLKKIDARQLIYSLNDRHPKVRAAAVRMSEPLLREVSDATAAVRQKILSLAADSAADVQIQVALTLGEISTDEVSQAALKALAQSKFTLTSNAANFSITAREPKVAAVAPASPKLSTTEMKRFETGKANYELYCLPCHQAHGLGQEGLAPPLVGSEWVAGSEQRLARIVLNGLHGPITVKGQTFELDMPALGILEDEQIATVLTYVRHEWNHAFPPVGTETIKQVRDQTADHADAWTQEELLKIK